MGKGEYVTSSKSNMSKIKADPSKQFTTSQPQISLVNNCITTGQHIIVLNSSFFGYNKWAYILELIITILDILDETNKCIFTSILSE